MYDIAIIGSGYAGIWALLAASELAGALRERIRIALVAPEPILVARPRLYEAALAEHDARIDMRELIETCGAEFVAGWVEEVAQGSVRLRPSKAERWLAARSLVVATGSGTEAPRGIPSHTIDSFRAARRFWSEVRAVTAADNLRRPSLAVVGAGLTGIEAAAEAAERFAGRLEVHLVDPGEDLRGWSDEARDYLRRHLTDRGVRLNFGRKVVARDGSAVRLDDGSTLPVDLLLWTAGLRPHQLAGFGGQHAADGRVLVEDSLRDPVSRGIFWAGDVAAAPSPDRSVTLMSCQYAMQLGTTAGRNAVLDLLGRPLEPFRPRPYVTCVGLGADGGLFTEGAERRVKYTGPEGAQVKKYIVEQAIVPPREQRRAA